jgi:hypothetical protein
MIGIKDPFSDEESNGEQVKRLPKIYSDLVYHKSRYIGSDSPKCIYFPSRYIMFKIMRASICVKNIEDLWIEKLE